MEVVPKDEKEVPFSLLLPCESLVLLSNAQMATGVVTNMAEGSEQDDSTKSKIPSLSSSKSLVSIHHPNLYRFHWQYQLL